jgi:hypothetical protein
VTIHIPFRVKKRGGRKEICLPAETPQQHRAPDNVLVKALARAFRWKRMLDSGEFNTITELATHEKMAPSYMTRVLRLTLLAPELIEIILDEQHKAEVTLAQLVEPFPIEWSKQVEQFC